MSIPTFPRETVEFLPVPITADGVVTVTGITYSIVTDPTRPTVWDAPTTIDGKTGIMITGYTTPGLRRVYAKISDAPETPVIDCGLFRIV